MEPYTLLEVINMDYFTVTETINVNTENCHQVLLEVKNTTVNGLQSILVKNTKPFLCQNS